MVWSPTPAALLPTSVLMGLGYSYGSMGTLAGPILMSESITLVAPK